MALTKEQILSSPNKPAPCKVLPENIPAELRGGARYVAWQWRHDNRRNKQTKIPCAPGLTRPCDVAGKHRKQWWPFEMAVNAYNGNNLYSPEAQPDGIGLVIYEGDGLAAIDLDDCRNNVTGEIQPWAQGIIDRLNSYTEVSPSGTGVKVFVYASRPDDAPKRHGHVEIYVRARFMCMTGQRLVGTPATVNHRQAELDAVAAEFLPATEPTKPKAQTQAGAAVVYAHVAPIAEDAELIDRALRHPRFARLWNGDVSANDGDHSKADLSLCCSLAFWTHGDESRMDRLFRASALYRPKWDEHRGKRTYGEITIAKACRLTTSYWNPDAVTRMATACHATPGVNSPADLLLTTIVNMSVPEMTAKLWDERQPGDEIPPALTRTSCHICCGDHSADECTANKPPTSKRHDPHCFYRPHAPRSQYCGIVKHFGCSFTGRGASPHLLCESRWKCERCRSHLDWQLWSLTDECIVLSTLTAAQQGREPLLYRWVVPSGPATRAVIKRIKRASGPNDGYRTIKQAGGLTWILSSTNADGAETLTEAAARAELVTAIRKIPEDVRRPWDGSRTWAMPDETPTHDCPACGGDIPRPPAASREMAPSGKMICDCPHCRRRVEVIPPMRELGITTQVDPAEPANVRARRQLEAVGCIAEKTTTDPKSRSPVPILAWRLGPQYAGMEEVAMRGLAMYLATCEVPPGGDLTADMFGDSDSLSDLLLPGLFSDRVNRTGEAKPSTIYGAHPPPN